MYNSLVTINIYPKSFWVLCLSNFGSFYSFLFHILHGYCGTSLCEVTFCLVLCVPPIQGLFFPSVILRGTYTSILLISQLGICSFSDAFWGNSLFQYLSTSRFFGCTHSFYAANPLSALFHQLYLDTNKPVGSHSYLLLPAFYFFQYSPSSLRIITMLIFYISCFLWFNSSC